MNRHRRQLFVAAALLAAGTVAHAQLPAAEENGPAGGKMRHRRHGGKRRFQHDPERRAQQQQAFKDELQLSESQQAAWDRYQHAIQPQARSRDEHRHEDWSNLSTPERLDRMQARQAERQQHMEQRMQAVRDFYAQLNPEQQKAFDQRARRHGRGPRGKFMRQPKV